MEEPGPGSGSQLAFAIEIEKVTRLVHLGAQIVTIVPGVIYAGRSLIAHLDTL